MKPDALHFLKEILGRALLITFSIQAAFHEWWIPLILAPVFWQFWDLGRGRFARINHAWMKLFADLVTYVVYLGYMAYAVVSCGQNIGHWYGWVAGTAIAVIIAHLLGLLWPQRWHLEKMDEIF